MDTFFDRAAELAQLMNAWRQAVGGLARLVVMSGHRRVGKTYLLSHLLEQIQGRRVFYAATQQTEVVELGRFARALRAASSDDVLLADGGAHRTWEDALTAVAVQSRTRPTLVVIDEAPYLEYSTPGFASIVQAVWDRVRTSAPASRLMLVLTGSAASVMERITRPNGPLRGRVDLHLRLQPFDLPTVAGILGTDPVRAIEAYAACGGWPLHVSAWDPAATTRHNLDHLAGQAGGVLLEDADVILQELPDGPGYGRVLAAIGRGRTRYSGIADEAGQRIENPLSFLVDSGLVRRDVPVGAPRRTRPEYQIADPYLRFWFQVLYGERARIQGGQGKAVLSEAVGAWQAHLGWVFEEAAREHARRLVAAGTLQPEMTVGRWWTASGPHAEIDVLGLHRGRTHLVGEAKWAAGSFDRRWVQRLRDRLPRLPDPADEPHIVLWTRSTTSAPSARSVHVYGPSDLVEPGSAR